MPVSSNVLILAAVAVAIGVYLYLRNPPNPPPPVGPKYTQLKALSPPNNDSFIGRVSGSLVDIENACTAKSTCAGYTSDGSLYSFIPNTPTLVASNTVDTYRRPYVIPSNYNVLPNKTGPQSLKIVRGYVPDLASECDKDSKCVGFNMSGNTLWLIDNPETVPNNSQDNVFVKKFSPPVGYTMTKGAFSPNSTTIMNGPSAYVPDLASLCNKTPNCTGFDTTRQILGGVINTNQPEPSVNTYTRI